MGLHQKHTHGRVFRDIAARDQMAIHKRDSHGNNPIMHVPEGFKRRQESDDSESDTDDSAVQVVYVTLSQTFSGDAIYSTLSDDDAGGFASSAAEPTRLVGKPVAATPTDASSSTRETSVATVSPAQTRSAATTLATATSSGGFDSDVTLESTSGAYGNAASATQSTTSVSTSTSTSQATTGQTEDTGMSTGNKAGLAVGIVLGLGLLAALAFFFFLKTRKRPSNEEDMNEKRNSFTRGAPIGAAAATGAFAARPMEHGERDSSKRDSTQTEKVPASVRSTRTASTAPRLSLRPITQLMTGFGDNRKSGGNALDVAATGGLAAPSQHSSWERRPSNDNPFNDADAHANTAPTDPFNGSTTTLNQPKTSWEGSEAQTPSSATFGAVAGTGPGTAPPQGANNVHRVQLDFKPSMDDELELRSGQLVRMLHEYDDGWVSAVETG